MKVIIIGAGALGVQFKHFIDHYTEDEVIGWLDDTRKPDEAIAEATVLGGLNDIHSHTRENVSFAIAIGYHHLTFKSQLIAKLLKEKIELYTFIHPSAIVDVSAKVASGVFVYPGVIIDQTTSIATGVILNNGVIVSHDSSIGIGTFLAPGVVVAGNVQIGEACFVGTASSIIDNITIVDNTTLGASSLVVDHITQSGKYVGGPHLKKL